MHRYGAPNQLRVHYRNRADIPKTPQILALYSPECATQDKTEVISTEVFHPKIRMESFIHGNEIKCPIQCFVGDLHPTWSCNDPMIASSENH